MEKESIILKKYDKKNLLFFMICYYIMKGGKNKMGFSQILLVAQLIMIILQVFGIIYISWFAVFIPIYILIGIGIALFFFEDDDIET